MYGYRRPTCTHPDLNGRSGICPDCRTSIWYYEPRPFSPTERAVQRAVDIMSRLTGTGLLPP